jgi:hypothetical protein
MIFDYILIAKVNERGKNYDAYDIEFLTIIEIFKEWRYYFEEIQHIIEIVYNY